MGGRAGASRLPADRRRGHFRATHPARFSRGALATTTSRFRWHALDIVVRLLAAFRISGEGEYLALARREAERWVDANFAVQSSDPKYAAASRGFEGPTQG
jgi:hypothetical protein